jgi:hypothetical protein
MRGNLQAILLKVHPWLALIVFVIGTIWMYRELGPDGNGGETLRVVLSVVVGASVVMALYRVWYVLDR